VSFWYRYDWSPEMRRSARIGGHVAPFRHASWMYLAACPLPLLLHVLEKLSSLALGADLDLGGQLDHRGAFGLSPAGDWCAYIGNGDPYMSASLPQLLSFRHVLICWVWQAIHRSKMRRFLASLLTRESRKRAPQGMRGG